MLSVISDGADINNSQLFRSVCISHKTISHRAAAAPGPEVPRECPMAYFPALPLLATNPGDATERTFAKNYTKIKYLGVHIVGAKSFKVSTDHCRRSFYRAANAILEEFFFRLRLLSFCHLRARTRIGTVSGPI